MTDRQINALWQREWRSASAEIPLWDAWYAFARIRDLDPVVFKV